jgi:integrative and conjugative element protein (TIGR02256 family)
MQPGLEDITYEVGGMRRFLVIKAEVLGHFANFRQIKIWQREAGGQLFGTFEESTITIRHATGPYKKDIRFRNRFTPCRKQEHSDIGYYYSMGQQFIGNWHTHPEDVPYPSETDCSNTRERFLRSDHQLLAFTMVIVGRSAFPLGLHVGLVNGSGHQTLKNVPETGLGFGCA